MLMLEGQDPVSAVADFTSASFPAVAAIAILPATSVVGSKAPFVPPDIS